MPHDNGTIKANVHKMVAKGVPDEEIQAYIDAAKSEVEPRSRTASAIMGAAQGATFGFGDEILGGIDAADKLLHGNTNVRENYAKAVERVRSQLREGRTSHPKITTASELAGGVLSAIPSAGGAVVKGGIRAGVKAGAGFGALAGVGNADSDPQRTLQGGVAGGVVGGLMGGAGSAIAPAAGRFVSKLTSRAIGREVPSGAAIRADNLVKTALERDKISFSALRTAAHEAGASGKPHILPDLAGQNVKGVARAAQAIPSEAKDALSTTLHERHTGQLDRIGGDLESHLGMNRRDVYEVGDEIIARRKASADPLYAEARSHGIVDVPEINALLERPTMKTALAAARRKAADEGVALPDGKVDVRTLDYVKRALDDKISTARRGGDNDDARVFGSLKDQLLEKLDATVPKFKEARQAFRGESELKDALESGRKFLSEDSRLTAKSMEGMSDAEKEMFRTGALDNVRQLMEKAQDGADLVKRIFGSPDKKAKLRVLFPDDASYNKFADQVERESQMVRTKDKVLGGSPTSRIDAEKSDMVGVAGNLARGNVASAAMQAVAKFFDNRAKGMNAKVADAISQRMLKTPAEISEYATHLEQQGVKAAKIQFRGRIASKALGNESGAIVSRYLR